MKLLLVEDEKKLADAMKRGLKIVSHTVDLVSDGRKALSRISLHGDKYDVVILDLVLPSMSGYDICKEVRGRGIRVPILILTAHTETETKEQLLHSGADDYLAKPFSFAELSTRIHRLHERSRAREPQRRFAASG